MKQLFTNLAKIILIVLVGVVIWKCASDHSENKEVSNNRECYEQVRKDLLIPTCLVEGFHKNPYHCGAKWTQGFGSTVHRNGKRVTKRDASISLANAKKDVYAHYDQHVWPFIEKYVTRTLTREQMLGVCSFIYNVGGEAFSGYNENGRKVGEPSNFLKAINAGKSDYETAICMNGFRRSAGRRANWLPKRHWIEGALYQGLITTEDILTLEPKRFYDERQYGFNINFYYKNRKGPYWTPDYSKKKIEEFLRKNKSASNNVGSLL